MNEMFAAAAAPDSAVPLAVLGEEFTTPSNTTYLGGTAWLPGWYFLTSFQFSFQPVLSGGFWG